MGKTIAGAVVAAAIAAAPLLVTLSPSAHATCVPGSNAGAYQMCCVAAQVTGEEPCPGYPPISAPPPSRVNPPSTPAPTNTPVRTPQPVPSYAPPSTVPVATPKINPPGPGAPKNAPLVTPPKRVEAPPEAVTAAKSDPATRVNPAAPPAPPTQPDFNHRVENVIRNHSGNVDTVRARDQALTRPRHWDYVDYDEQHHPALYNPTTEAMTFRYFYRGAYRELYIPAGGRIVLDVATAGVFAFTAVSDSYLASGSFYGAGAMPQVYQDVLASIPADSQTVQVGQLTVVGHDDNQPVGSEDVFMLDDSTLAWGQINDPGAGAQITVTKTQPLPGVGPTDNGSFLVALTGHEEPTHSWWPWVLGGAVLGAALVSAVGLIAWVVIRRKPRPI